jgi:hypothetical protein
MSTEELGDVRGPRLNHVLFGDDNEPSDVSPKTLNKASSSRNLAKPSSAGMLRRAKHAAWLLQLDEEHVTAIATSAVAAQFGQPFRIRVRDPQKDEICIELRTSGRRSSSLARFDLKLSELLTEDDWVLPLQERNFTEILSNRVSQSLKFRARIQFLAAGRAEGFDFSNGYQQRALSKVAPIETPIEDAVQRMRGRSFHLQRTMGLWEPSSSDDDDPLSCKEGTAMANHFLSLCGWPPAAAQAQMTPAGRSSQSTPVARSSQLGINATMSNRNIAEAESPQRRQSAMRSGPPQILV